MAQKSQHRIGRFDRVKLLTIKNVNYISSTIDKPSTGGLWTVIGLVNDELLLHQGITLIRIPATDVLKMVDYEDTINTFYTKLRSLSDGQGQETTSGRDIS
jgi:hypothetical protein